MAEFADTGIVLEALRGGDLAEPAWKVLVPGTVIGRSTLDMVAAMYRDVQRLSWPAIIQKLSLLRAGLKVVPSTLEDHDLSMLLAERYDLPVQHAVGPAQALLAGCRVIWSHWLPPLLTFDGKLQARNPFHPPDAV